MIRVAINGFGRIGRNFLRAIVQDKKVSENVRVVAVNVGPADPQKIVHMFKYDTMMGTFHGTVELKGNMLHVNDQVMEVIAERDPERAPWARLNIDWVAECSGFFTKRDGASKHLAAGAHNVLISAPAKGEDVSIVLGVNDEMFEKGKHKIVSLGSCTTNAIVPVLKVLHDAFGIEHGFMTTVHAYTNTQVLLDVETDDLRRARAAALNIIPTSTGATDVLARIIPELDGKIGGMSLRVPVAKVSIIDLAFVAQRQLSVAALADVFTSAAASTKMQGILAVTDAPLVSSDFSGDPHSVVVDLPLLDVRANVGKVFGWYDNEWGYSERLKDFLYRVS